MSGDAFTTRRWAPPLVGFGSLLLILAAVEILIRLGVINGFIVPLPSEVAASFTRVILEEERLSLAHQLEELGFGAKGVSP